MAGFFDAVRAGVKGVREGNDSSEYSIAGKTVHCPHCEGRQFRLGRALLNTRARTAVGVDWADPGATVLVCATCSRIEWFATAPESGSNA